MGTEGSDVLVETAGNDSILALGGDDIVILDKLTGTGFSDGGDGSDRLVVDLRSQAFNSIFFGPGAGTVHSFGTNSFTNFEHYTLYHKTGNFGDSFSGGNGDDIYYFTATNNADFQRFISFVYLGGGANDMVVIDGSAVVDFTLSLTADILTGPFLRFRVGGSPRIELRDVERVDIIGGALGDTIVGLVCDDVMDGRGGNDTLHGQDGDDRLIGGAGDDTLDGFWGDDTLVVGSGADTAYGSDGSDRLEIDARTQAGLVQLLITAPGPSYDGNVAWNGGSAAYTSIEHFTIRSSAGNHPDDIRTGAGDDVFYHYGIDDLSYLIDVIDLGAGSNDLLVADFSAVASLVVSNRVHPSSAGHYLFDVGGNGKIDYTGVERIHFIGGAQGDLVTGLAAADILEGRGGNDSLAGADGNDDIAGGTGTNSIDGGDGDDILRSGSLGVDTVQGGPGTDSAIVDYSAQTVAVTNLSGGDVAFGNGTDTKVTLTAVERIVIATGSGNDAIATLGGNDEIRTGAGTDTLNGGGGNDYIDGGTGADSMSGGAGNDVFIVEDAGDTIVEATGEGTDQVYTRLAVYELPANVENVTATTGIAHDYRGNGGDNALRGSVGNDFFRLQDGGSDSGFGGAGNDVFLFGGAMGATDFADGGAGVDQLAIQGDYWGANALTLGGGLVSIENIAILPGSDTRFGDPGTNLYDYHIIMQNAAIAAGTLLTVDANRLQAGEDFIFDGSAETDASFFIFGGAGTDLLTGGASGDVFLFGAWGQWNPADVIVGGGGIDQLALRGNYTLTLGAGQLIGIENIGLLSAHDTRFGALGSSYSYEITTVDENVAAGVQMVVDGAKLRIAEFFRFDGSDESDGTFLVFGGLVGDTIIGGEGNDILVGGAGADTLTGGPGADLYRYRGASESTGPGYDTIDGFVFGTDQLDLPGAHDSYGTRPGGALSTATFDDDLTAAMNGVLNPGQAIFFTPDSGTLAGRIFLVVDDNGTAGYQAGADFVIELVNTSLPGTVPDFIV